MSTPGTARKNHVNPGNSQVKHVKPANSQVNLEIVLKQAAVLLGLLSGLPNFGACLQQALQEPCLQESLAAFGVTYRLFL